MTEYARLVVAVDSSQVTKARSEQDKMTASSGKLERAAGRISPAALAAGAAIAGMISIQALRSAQQLSEQFVLLEARVKRMSNSAAEAEVTYGRLADVARRTGSDLGDTVQLWESLTGTLRELGATDSQVIRLTETLQKIGVVGGSSAEDMSNALRQLGQALAGGQLRAEEFNAIVEGMPELAREIARGLGIPFGELRQQMLSGELTAERVLGAIQNRASSVDAEFAKLPRTVSQASAALTNNFGRAISALDKAIGGSASLAKFLDILAKGIRFTAGDFTDFERLNQLTTERAEKEAQLEERRKKFVRSKGLELALENQLKTINAEILTIQERRVKQQQEEAQELGKSGTARNEEYDKYLAKLAESAALQGQNSEAAKVRYAIETKALGDLKPEQERALLAYAEEIDAKRTATDRTNELEKASEQLEQSYATTVQALERQLAMYGATGEAAKTRFEIEQGSLKGIVGQQAEYLIGLARELDAKRDLSEQEKIRIDILRESGQLRAANDAQFELEYAEKIAEYEKQGNQEALQRLETLKRIREIQMNADQAPGTVEGVSKAPGSGGLDAAVGGAGSELIRLQLEAQKLETWRAVELEKQRAFLEAKAINEETHAERVANIHQQAADAVMRIQGSQTLAAMTMAQGLSNNLMALMHQAGLENTAFYKAMFLTQRALAVGQAIISTELAAVAAMAPPPLGLGPAAGLPYSNLIRGMGYASVALIGAQTAVGLSGMAHDGIDSIPREGTWLLDKGERVVDRRTNADLKEYLSDGGRGGGGGGIVIHAPVTVEAQPGTSQEDAQQYGREFAGAMTATVIAAIEKESRPGGLLWNLYGGGR